jgi:two-component system, OmpR family, phosphate regulon response regulator OmpR
MSSMSQSLLLIDDDKRLTDMLRDYLGAAGFGVAVAGTGEAGLAALETGRPAAVILDVMLPDLDGFDVLRRLRRQSDVPVLMLTARGDDLDRIVGLEIGADDYLAKPFNPRELVARIKAILRRGRSETEGGEEVLHFGRLTIDRASRQVRIGNAQAPMTSHQFDLLVALATHAGRVLSRDQLMDYVRGSELEAFDRSIDVHISRIRSVIEDDPKEAKRIITVRGAGYVFAKAQD